MIQGLENITNDVGEIVLEVLENGIITAPEEIVQMWIDNQAMYSEGKVTEYLTNWKAEGRI